MFKNFLKTLAIFCVVIHCTACKQQPNMAAAMSKAIRQQHLQHMKVWQAEGRVAIQDNNQAQNASFTWNQNQDFFKVYFYSPFSSDSVTISGSGTQINVTATNGATQEEVLLERELPLAQLAYWAKGVPAPVTAPQSSSYDARNQLQQLQQDGWLIEYQSYQDTSPVSLPEKITLTNENTKVKLLLKRWQK